MVEIPEAALSSGHRIPLIGLGTFSYPPPAPEVLAAIFVTAMEVGYRHFDTAAVYHTEEPLGAAIAEALRRGIIKTRDELFITSKLWCSDAHPDLVLPAIKRTLQNLGQEYVDLYLIHWPVASRRTELKTTLDKEDLVAVDVKRVWESMETAHAQGLAKSIGVSNFSCKKLLDLLAVANIPPAVNQVEMNVGWQQKQLMELCQQKGVHVSAWSPLAANGALWGSLNIITSPILKDIAEAKGKSVAQVALRWLHEQGVSVVAKSFKKERMEENMDIFSWQLTQEEERNISQIPQCKSFPGENFVSSSGPFKTIEELWDGEI